MKKIARWLFPRFIAILCVQLFYHSPIQGAFEEAPICTGTVKSQGFDLGYRIEGSGPNALVIGSSVYYPRVFSENLREHLRCIFADIRPFAPTPNVELPLTFDLNSILDDIEFMRQKLDLGEVIIIGHSGNALIAIEYAKKYSQNVSHVVMIGTGPFFGDKSNEAADQYWEDTASIDRKAALHKSFELYPDSQYGQIPSSQQFIWNYIRYAARIWYDFDFDSTPLWEGVNVNMPIFDYVWKTLLPEVNIANNLESLHKPIFLALGRYDFVVPSPNSWSTLHSKYKNLSIHVFEESGHSPFYEEQELFDTKLLEWLSSH